MNTADPATKGLWDEIEVEDEWVGQPKKENSSVTKTIKGSFNLMAFCCIAFLVGVIPGYLTYDSGSPLMDTLLDDMREEIGLNQPSNDIALSIFMNNFKASLVMFIGGTFIVVPVLTLIFNGFFLGYVLRLFLSQGYSIFDFIAGIFFHGILELPAIFLSAALGLQIGLSYILPKKNRVLEVSSNIKKSITAYVFIVLPMLLVAAYIETYISTAILGV